MKIETLNKSLKQLNISNYKKVGINPKENNTTYIAKSII